MRKLAVFCALLTLAALTDGVAQKRRIIRAIENAEEKIGHHVGFYLYDPVEKEELVNYKGAKYFTPASNTKILTFYASLKVLGDSIPALYYKETEDSLIIWGTGDPSLFYERVPTSQISTFLKNSGKAIYLSDGHFDDSHFGEAWAWDDYAYSYQVEKAPLPIFGNYYSISKRKGKQTLEITNNSFKKYFGLKDSLTTMPPVLRDYGSNRADYYPRDREEEFTRRVPFQYSNELAAEMLGDTLKRSVKAIHRPLAHDRKIRYSILSDSLYKSLIQPSDNFIAEQLLLTISGLVSDTLNTAKAIAYSKENFLSDLPDEVLWFDGSGLSRYNQFTPRSIVGVWEKIYNEFGTERVFPLLATGGKTGTLQNLYASDKPYIYGKTGTLRNHHCLSGFILTDKGNTLLFSYMNGHYPGSSSTVKEDMERILLMVKERY